MIKMNAMLFDMMYDGDKKLNLKKLHIMTIEATLFSSLWWRCMRDKKKPSTSWVFNKNGFKIESFKIYFSFFFRVRVQKKDEKASEKNAIQKSWHN